MHEEARPRRARLALSLAPGIGAVRRRQAQPTFMLWSNAMDHGSSHAKHSGVGL